MLKIVKKCIWFGCSDAGNAGRMICGSSSEWRLNVNACHLDIYKQSRWMGSAMQSGWCFTIWARC